MKRLLVVLLLVFLCMVSVSASAYDTPQAVAEAFTVAISSNDFETALDLYGFETRAAEYDFVQMLNRLKVYMPSLDMPAPSYEAYAPLNAAVARGRSASYLYYFAISFLTAEDYVSAPYSGFDEQWPAAFAESVDPAQLHGLTLISLLDPPLADDERTIADFTTQAAAYGAAEKIEKIAVYTLDGRIFIGGFSFLRYGENWYIASLSSVLAGMNAYGQVVEVPLDEMEDALHSIGVE